MTRGAISHAHRIQRVTWREVESRSRSTQRRSSRVRCSVGPVPGQPNGPPGLELFRRADFLEDFPSVMTHRVCCNGVFWSFTWYEPRANMSYTLDLSRNVAQRYGNSSVDGDVNAARAVAA